MLEIKGKTCGKKYGDEYTDGFDKCLRAMSEAEILIA